MSGIRDSLVGLAASYGLDGLSLIPGKSKIFSLLRSVQNGYGVPTHPPIRWVRRVKQPKREADHSPPSSPEIKDGGVIPSLPP
jgi:hypothetical protein